MNSARRPSPRDWGAALVAGALLGSVILGIGGRFGMWLVAIEQGRTASFSAWGSLRVVFFGAVAGCLVAAIFMGSRALLPGRRVWRSAAFWGATGAFVLSGIRPLTVVNIVVFAPLFVAHGALLTAWWCRLRLRRIDREAPSGHELGETARYA